MEINPRWQLTSFINQLPKALFPGLLKLFELKRRFSRNESAEFSNNNAGENAIKYTGTATGFVFWCVPLGNLQKC